MDREPECVRAVLADDAVSYRLKRWLREALTADPVDAARDAATLSLLLNARAAAVVRS